MSKDTRLGVKEIVLLAGVVAAGLLVSMLIGVVVGRVADHLLRPDLF